MAKPKTTKTTKLKTDKTEEGGIAISPKHGLNPSLGICFYCGKETGEIVLNGRMKRDKKAPKYVVLNYEPCKECQKQWEGNMAFIGVTSDKPEDNRPMIDPHRGLYPTGAYIVVTEDCGRRVLDIPEGQPSPAAVLMDNEIILDFVQKGKEANGKSDNQ